MQSRLENADYVHFKTGLYWNDYTVLKGVVKNYIIIRVREGVINKAILYDVPIYILDKLRRHALEVQFTLNNAKGQKY